MKFVFHLKHTISGSVLGNLTHLINYRHCTVYTVLTGHARDYTQIR